MTDIVHSRMRTLKVVAAMAMLFIVAAGLLLWTPIPCLEPPTALAVAQNTSWSPMQISQSPPTKEPPPSAGGLQFSWDYSDLVCTGLAAQPQRTGIEEELHGVDRDQLAVRVELQTCFKGSQPSRRVTVLGDTVFASKNTHGGIVYAGPPIGFVAPGRNLLFLRATKSSVVWRVTLPTYAACLPLADVSPEYGSDGSDDSIRRALVAEIEAAMAQGHLRNDRFAFQACNSLSTLLPSMGRTSSKCTESMTA